MDDETLAMPPDAPWYDYLIRPLLESQAKAEAGHAQLATSLRALAVLYRGAGQQIARGLDEVAGELERMADGHQTLAVAVPAAAQAAADLGTAAERHDVNNLRAIVVGEQGLAVAREADVTALRGDVQALTARMDQADVDRGEILRLLREIHANGSGGKS